MRSALDRFTTAHRTVAGLATLTLIAALFGLYQANVRAKRPPEFTRGGTFAATEASPPPPTGGAVRPPEPSPSAAVVRPSRTRARISGPAPRPTPAPRSSDIPAPAPGTYTYAVEGSESATAFGSRTYPAEMTMAVHRNAPDLEPDEIVLDLDFSPQHEERHIVAFRSTGVLLTFEGGSVTFGAVTQTTDAAFDPPVAHVPLPLRLGETREGTSEARNGDGDVVRTETWTASVVRREPVDTGLGRIEAWVIQVDRQTTSGSDDQLTRSRTYWLDASRGVWVKWTDESQSSRPLGLGRFEYTSSYTATLQRFTPAA